MRSYLLLSLLVIAVFAQDEESSSKPPFMERIVQTLPNIGNVIKGQMEGNPDELK